MPKLPTPLRTSCHTLLVLALGLVVMAGQQYVFHGNVSDAAARVFSGEPAGGSEAHSSARTCRPFSYSASSGVTYRFYSLRISRARCSTIKKIVKAYFHGEGTPAGQVPTDGSRVRGWNFLIIDRTIQGRKRSSHFSGRYR